MSLPVLQPSRVTVMVKPVGALCNLDCTYCYYLPTKTIYDGREKRMSLRTLENIFASVLPRFGDEVTIAWQGGEPTLAGMPFFEKAIEYQEKYRRPNQRVNHALQTNGTLLDDDWCKFLARHEFLIGLSMDGPPRFHDHYRISNRKQPTSDKVLAGMKLMKKHGVEHNILCVINDFNVEHPDELFGYLANLGQRWLQFIPAIEWEPDTANPVRNKLAPYSPQPEPFGRFLCRTFDIWFEKYRASLSVRDFDAVLNKLVLGRMPLCILDGSCHNQITIEHDGSVFGCDHFVERRWQHAHIGEPGWKNPINLDGSQSVGLTVHGTGYQRLEAGTDIHTVTDTPVHTEPTEASEQPLDADWYDRIDAQRLGTFAVRKQHLPPTCLSCEWKPYCHGGCPKHRPMGGDVPEPTVLCESYKMFYSHAMPRMQWLAGFLRAGQQPPPPAPLQRVGRQTAAESLPGFSAVATAMELMSGTTVEKAPRARAAVGRNDPCPCGSGLKYKKCHGKNV